MKRFTFEKKGYDCKHAPCEHEKKSDHGINGGSWTFGVADEDVAISLMICTSFYPETVPPAHRVSGWPVVKDRITGVMWLHRKSDSPDVLHKCDFLGECHCDVTCLGYGVCDQFAPLLAETFEPQPEAFWKRLEEILVSVAYHQNRKRYAHETKTTD